MERYITVTTTSIVCLFHKFCIEHDEGLVWSLCVDLMGYWEHPTVCQFLSRAMLFGSRNQNIRGCFAACSSKRCKFLEGMLSWQTTSALGAPRQARGSEQFVAPLRLSTSPRPKNMNPQLLTTFCQPVTKELSASRGFVIDGPFVPSTSPAPFHLFPIRSKSAHPTGVVCVGRETRNPDTTFAGRQVPRGAHDLRARGCGWRVLRPRKGRGGADKRASYRAGGGLGVLFPCAQDLGR